MKTALCTVLKYQVAKFQFCNSLDRRLSFTFQFYCTILVIVKLLLKLMKEYLLKQPKATCDLFSIACKINLGHVKNYGNPGGRGVFGLGNPGGRWGHSDPGNLGGRGGGGQKTLPSVRGGGGLVWNNSLSKILLKRF